jgi:hypothetical protein
MNKLSALNLTPLVVSGTLAAPVAMFVSARVQGLAAVDLEQGIIAALGGAFFGLIAYVNLRDLRS